MTLGLLFMSPVSPVFHTEATVSIYVTSFSVFHTGVTVTCLMFVSVNMVNVGRSKHA